MQANIIDNQAWLLAFFSLPLFFIETWHGLRSNSIERSTPPPPHGPWNDLYLCVPSDPDLCILAFMAHECSLLFCGGSANPWSVTSAIFVDTGASVYRCGYLFIDAAIYS